MTEPADDTMRLRVHRPRSAPGESTPTDGRTGTGEWIFADDSDSDESRVTMSPRVITVALLTLLVLVTAYLLLPSLFGSSGGRSRAAPGIETPSASPSASATSAPSAPAVPSTVVSSVDAAAVQAWYDADGAPILLRMGSTIEEIEDAITARDGDDVAAGCGQLADLADEARTSRPPGTDTAVASYWDDAADSIAVAADGCLAAADGRDRATAEVEVERAERARTLAQRAIEASL